MHHIGIFLRVVLGLFVGFFALLAFAIGPYMALRQPAPSFFVAGLMILIGVSVGSVLGWVAYKLVIGAFRTERLPAA